MISNLEDIQNLITNKIKESLTLEYKRELDKENKEIAKDISAFANTSGGTIVYGVNEENGIPLSINWLDVKNVRERIESICLTNIQPKLENIEIISIENPENLDKAIFVVNIQESLLAPHMVDYKYYKRYNYQSVPMEDREVKNLIFRKGLRKALKFEINENFEIGEQNWKLIDKIYPVPDIIKPIAFIPLHTDAWKTVISSGLLGIVESEFVDRLVKAYGIIDEINYFINMMNDLQKTIPAPVVRTADSESGTYIPAIIRDKLQKLLPILNELRAKF